MDLQQEDSLSLSLSLSDESGSCVTTSGRALNAAASGFSLPRGAHLGLAMLLALAAWVPTAGASESTTACDGFPLGDWCTELPPVNVPGNPIDRDQWVPWPPNQDPFPDVGFDSNEFAGGGYVPEAQQMQCSTWMDANEPPPGCDSASGPVPVSPSDPPCGPDGSWVSQFIPQNMANACVAHDVCYSQLDSVKDRCDDAFHSNLALVCEQQHPLWWMMTDPGFALCLSQMDAYYLAVRLPWADNRFGALQSEAQCRQWHSRRDNESDCP